MITISNWFSLGFRLSSARLIGIIQHGTATWHFDISSRALAFKAGAVLPVPLPIRLTVCFHPCRACFMSMSASVLRKRWYHPHFSAYSAVIDRYSLLSRKLSAWSCSKGSFVISSIRPESCFHFHASSIVSGTVSEPWIPSRFWIASAHCGAIGFKMLSISIRLRCKAYLPYISSSRENVSIYFCASPSVIALASAVQRVLFTRLSESSKFLVCRRRASRSPKSRIREQTSHSFGIVCSTAPRILEVADRSESKVLIPNIWSVGIPAAISFSLSFA